MPGIGLNPDFWRTWRRRITVRAVTGAMTLLAQSRRTRGLALRTLLDRQLAPGVLCRVPFEDHTLYVDPRDDKIAQKLLAGRPWQRRELEAAIGALRDAGRLRPGGLFLDVGANIGAQTVYAMLSGAFAGAVAIEPDPHNFAILERNLAANSLADRVRAIAAAASAASGRLALSRHGNNYGGHSVEPAFVPKPAGALEVEAVSLDDLTHRMRIDPDEVALVKIDVEGHELAVLEGMAGLRSAGVPLLVELTAGPAGTARVEAFKALLAPHYGRAMHLPSGERMSAGPSDLGGLALRGQSDLLVF